MLRHIKTLAPLPPTELAEEPHLRQPPVAHDRASAILGSRRPSPRRSVRRNTATRRPGPSVVHMPQRLQCVVELHDIPAEARSRRPGASSSETIAHRLRACGTGGRAPHRPASPHQPGGHREEMLSVLPLHALDVDQPQVRLVDEGRWLKRVTCPFAANMLASNSTYCLYTGERVRRRRPGRRAPRREARRWGSEGVRRGGLASSTTRSAPL